MPVASCNSETLNEPSLDPTSRPQTRNLVSKLDIPPTMRAAVYRGNRQVVIETVETPAIGAGELLIRVETCGICHTDLKKIEHDLLPPPRIYGHETAGVVVKAGPGVTGYHPGDRVIVFHHVPCRNCFYCERRLYAQCPVYKRVGVGAGFEPAGGGFAQFVRVSDWVTCQGVERIPDHVSFDQACWVEPVNTCLKAVRQLGVTSGDCVAVLGQGPIGLIFTMLVQRYGAKVIASDTREFRRELSGQLGARTLDPRDESLERACRDATSGRGADAVIVATAAPGIVEQAVAASRPGAKILLFAQTAVHERIELAGAEICVGERILFGSYSADIDLQAESARLVFSGELGLEQMISHRVTLDQMQFGIETATHARGRSLKVVLHPQERTL